MTDIENFIKLLISKEINTSIEEIDSDEYFSSFGIDSMRAVALLDAMEKETGLDLNPLIFWDYPTIASLSKHINSCMNKAKS